MTDFVIKQGSTAPGLQYTVNDLGVDFTDAVVTFSLFNVDTQSTFLYRVPALVVNPTAPAILGYDWQEGDTIVQGLYRGEFHVLFPNSKIGIFPDPGHILVEIERAIPSA